MGVWECVLSRGGEVVIARAMGPLSPRLTVPRWGGRGHLGLSSQWAAAMGEARHWGFMRSAPALVLPGLTGSWSGSSLQSPSEEGNLGGYSSIDASATIPFFFF